MKLRNWQLIGYSKECSQQFRLFLIYLGTEIDPLNSQQAVQDRPRFNTFEKHMHKKQVPKILYLVNLRANESLRNQNVIRDQQCREISISESEVKLE